LARASALHAEGHRFDSDILHKQLTIIKFFKIECFRLRQKIGSNPFTLTKSV